MLFNHRHLLLFVLHSSRYSSAKQFGIHVFLNCRKWESFGKASAALVSDLYHLRFINSARQAFSTLRKNQEPVSSLAASSVSVRGGGYASSTRVFAASMLEEEEEEGGEEDEVVGFGGEMEMKKKRKKTEALGEAKDAMLQGQAAVDTTTTTLASTSEAAGVSVVHETPAE